MAKKTQAQRLVDMKAELILFASELGEHHDLLQKIAKAGSAVLGDTPLTQALKHLTTQAERHTRRAGEIKVL